MTRMAIQTDDFEPARRVVSAAPASPNEEAIERALRPKGLAEYVGQAKAREQLAIFIHAARGRAEALDLSLIHIFMGPETRSAGRQNAQSPAW